MRVQHHFVRLCHVWCNTKVVYEKIFLANYQALLVCKYLCRVLIFIYFFNLQHYNRKRKIETYLQLDTALKQVSVVM